MEEIKKSLPLKIEYSLGNITVLGDGMVGHSKLKEIFYDLMLLISPDVFLEVGANDGEISRRAKRVFPRADVYAFEANTSIYDKYYEANKFDGVNWYNLAICDKVGSVELNIPRVLGKVFFNGTFIEANIVESDETGRSSILHRDEEYVFVTQKVPATTLDDFLSGRLPTEGAAIALWIDVEGAGFQVLSGCLNTLHYVQLICIEVETFSFWKDQALVDEVLEILGEAGFRPLARDMEYGDAQFNIIFLKKEFFLNLSVKHLIDFYSRNKEGGRRQRHSVGQPVTPQNVPVIVPCFNNPTYCELMRQQLISLGFESITYVDNNSESESMLEWIRKVTSEGIKVERVRENLGPRNSVFTEQRLASLPRWFCVTDPDLVFNPFLPKDFLAIMSEELVERRVSKAGFALDISELQFLRREEFRIGQRMYTIREWESQFWDSRKGFTVLGDAIYEAPIDTTFALYDLRSFELRSFLAGLRIAGKFTAIHAPWLTESVMSDNELGYYRRHQKFSTYF